uniref:Uncharacterized protein n=1 Tax=Lepeophtheirus salmonis TaxID=72036 RepID=A0A0K2V2B4_LEPSM
MTMQVHLKNVFIFHLSGYQLQEGKRWFLKYFPCQLGFYVHGYTLLVSVKTLKVLYFGDWSVSNRN